jgi:hypothetical protein
MRFFNCLLPIVLLSILYACEKDSEIIDTITESAKNEIPPWEPEYYNINKISFQNTNYYTGIIRDVKYALPFSNWYDEKENLSVILNIEGVSYEFLMSEKKPSGVIASYKNDTGVIKIRKDSLEDLFKKEEDFKIQYHVENPTNTLLNYDTLIVHKNGKPAGGSGDYNNILSFNLILKHKNPIYLISLENIERSGTSILINGISESDKSLYKHTDEGTFCYEYMPFNQKANDFKLELFSTYSENKSITLLETIPAKTGNTVTKVSYKEEVFTILVSIVDYNYNQIIVTRGDIPIDEINQGMDNWNDGGDETFIFDL